MLLMLATLSGLTMLLMLATLSGLTMLASLSGHEVGHAAGPPLSAATLPGLGIRAVGRLLAAGTGLCGLGRGPSDA